MAKNNQVNIKFDDETFRDIEKCSKADFNRGVTGIVRHLVMQGLPDLKKELGVDSSKEDHPVSGKHSKYAVPGRSKLRGKRGISAQAEN